MRFEINHCFKLKAAYLGDCDTAFVRLESVSGVRYLNVPDEQSFFFEAFNYLVSKRCGSRFSVCSGYSDNRSLVVPVCKFNLSPYRDAVLSDSFHNGCFKGNSRADNADVNF